MRWRKILKKLVSASAATMFFAMVSTSPSSEQSSTIGTDAASAPNNVFPIKNVNKKIPTSPMNAMICPLLK